MQESSTYTDYERDLLAQFRTDPKGLMVELHDGRQGVVARYRSTSRGRQLCIAGQGGFKWVYETAVASVVYWTLSLAEESMPRATA